jgi:hypothetical protein
MPMIPTPGAFFLRPRVSAAAVLQYRPHAAAARRHPGATRVGLELRGRVGQPPTLRQGSPLRRRQRALCWAMSLHMEVCWQPNISPRSPTRINR